MIIKLNKPFMAISKVTDYVYKVDTIEINDKGKIINYIIHNKVWNPSRFRVKIYLELEEKDKLINELLSKLIRL